MSFLRSNKRSTCINDHDVAGVGGGEGRIVRLRGKQSPRRGKIGCSVNILNDKM
jgi:hypothetical protein